MNDKNLPPLPEPQKTVCIVDSERGLSWTYWRTPAAPVFTADQMRAYARAALASPAAQAQPVALTEEQRLHLGQAAEMLDDYAHECDIRGLDSICEGAKASAYVLRKMLAAPEALAPDTEDLNIHPGDMPEYRARKALAAHTVAGGQADAVTWEQLVRQHITDPARAAQILAVPTDATAEEAGAALAAHPAAVEVQRHAPAEQPEREAAVVKDSLTDDELTDVAREPLSDERQLAEFIAWGNETFNYGFKPETWDAITHEFTDDPTDMAWIAWRGSRGIPARVDSEGSKP